MGCWFSSPHSLRKYRDFGDLDEVYVPYRYFGTARPGSNLIPDDIGGLPSTHEQDHLSSDKDPILYEAEIDHGQAFRCFRLAYFCLFSPVGLAYVAAQGLFAVFQQCACDEMFCWVRKEYSTRRYMRVYSNRIEINQPGLRCPFGVFGCGSWNADKITAHPFDRGAFGFHRVDCCTLDFLCCIWPVYGGVVARQRCNCNGPVWNRMFTDCGGWWCDEWLCKSLFCSYRYPGLADPDEVAFAASVALQAYFEGRQITPTDMAKCIKYWRDNIAEQTAPIERKREVCCEPVMVPCPSCVCCYKAVHPTRSIPYGDDQVTDEITEAFGNYNDDCEKQIKKYKEFHGPVRNSTVCRMGGCRRFFGRKGFIFCTEGCENCGRKAGEPAPPVQEHDFDDEHDASTLLMAILGPPPPNVVIQRWRYDPEAEQSVLDVYPPSMAEESVENSKDV